jgi:hydrogenase maturation factor HypF (carbamoyltransferase family)
MLRLKQVVLATAAVAVVASVGYYVYTHLESEPLCQACYRAIHGETHYRVHFEDGSVEHVCCPRCGLRVQAGRSDVVSADASDFLTQESIDAKGAFYVEGSAVVMCRHDERVKEDRSGAQYQLTWDRCLPSVIAFSTRDAAETFQKQSGGTVRTYAELQREQR